MTRERADKLLCERGLAATRSKAADLIRRGQVRVNGAVLTKPGALVERDARLELVTKPRFVSRGGDKLDGALDALGVSVEGLTIVDVGASTGGFTDCVLSRGARKVYAVDVGHDQLDPKLRADARVDSREGVNARDLRAEDFVDAIDLAVVDASFIGVEKLLPALARVVRPRGALLVLVKPQFEVGPDVARRSHGVIRDRAERDRAIDQARAAIEREGFSVRGECDSAVAGPRGNVEHFVFATRRG